MNLKKFFLILALAVPVWGDQIALDTFGYLNNDEAAAIIDINKAQDLLNVDVTAGGKSIKKREGFGSYKTVTGSQAMHGGHHFYDASGNDVQVWGSSTSLFGIVSDGTPTQLVSSATVNTSWDCADTQGNAYCVNTSRNALIKTNGATMTWYSTVLGTIVAVTPERLLVAGVAASPNTIFYSESNNFVNFTPGVAETSPSSEQIAAPGSRITHLEYGCGKWLWWKDQSFGYVLGNSVLDLTVVIVSNNIGTLDNSSATDPNGNVYFRAQDGHIYKFDCNALEKLTTEITPNVQSSAQRISNSYTESLQSEFQAGTIVPTGQLSTTITAGDVTASSFTATDTTAANFSAGTLSNMQTSSNSVILSTNSTDLGSSYTLGTGWALEGPGTGNNCGVMSDQDSDGFVKRYTGGTTSSYDMAFSVYEVSGQLISSTTVAYASGACSWTLRTLPIGAANARKYVVFSAVSSIDSASAVSGNFTTNGTNFTFYTRSDVTGSSHRMYFDTAGVGAVSTIGTGNFTSQAFNTGITRSYVALSYNATVNQFTPAFALQDSTSTNGPWAEIGTAAGVNYSARQFVRYLSTFTVTGSSDAATSLDDVTLVSRSSGTYYSPVIVKPNLTTWDTLNANVTNGGGSHSFYMRASNAVFTALAASPAWTAVTNGSVIPLTNGATYFQFRDDFIVTTATHTPSMSDFTINWFEGTASDRAYATYFDDSVWWAVAFGDGQAANNYIFKYDLLHGGWTLYNIAANGFAIQNNHLYFGSSSSNSIYRYGDTTSDNGTAISAYWQSKDFGGTDPWLENEYVQFDTFARRNANQSLTVTYTLSNSSATAYAVSLSSSTDSFIRHKKLLPAGKIGGLLSVKFSDSSATSSWEVLGFRVKYNPLPYRPTP